MIRPQIHKEVPTRIPRSRIHALCDAVMKGESKARLRGMVNVVFTDDAALKQLNRQYRRKNRSTDVLSFNLEEPDEPEAVFGEIYISVPTARRQSLEYGVSLWDELTRLVCHGLLHLLGYDHEDPEEARQMRMLEDRYLSRLRRV